MIYAYWWRRVPNFGDAITPYLVRLLSGQSVQWSQSPDRPVLATVGSVLQSTKPGWHIWGSGLISADATIPHGLVVHAVRGPRSREVLTAHGYPPDLPLGDPGLLLPVIFPAHPTPTYEWGIVPHYIDYPLLAILLSGTRIRSLFTGQKRVLLINPLSSPSNYIRQLLTCRHVAASSLHGLISADAYGIPNVWFTLTRNPLKTFCLRHTTFVHDEFKYHDYLSSVGRAPCAPSLIRGGIPWEDWEARVESWVPIRWDPHPLLESFPHKGPWWAELSRRCHSHFCYSRPK